MPANLTPEFEHAEQRYRKAASDAERLVALQDMLSTIPKHKGTEKMQADLKRRLSQLRKAQQQTGHAKGPDPFHVPKSGAGQVVLAGPPNVGKSSLLAATTNAEARIADYPFTTLVPQPGMWSREDIQIELVDTPPLTVDHVPPGLLGTLRSADVVCVVAGADAPVREQASSTLEVLNARGLQLQSVPRSRLPPADPGIRSGLIAVNKVDLALDGNGAAGEALEELGLWVQPVSAHTQQGLVAWFDRLWRLLDMIRVYAKQPGKPPDLTKPFTLLEGSTIDDLARQIHRELPDTMKYARIWGTGHHDGQQVHRTQVLKDGDIVEIHE